MKNCIVGMFLTHRNDLTQLFNIKYWVQCCLKLYLTFYYHLKRYHFNTDRPSPAFVCNVNVDIGHYSDELRLSQPQKDNEPRSISRFGEAETDENKMM